MVSGINQIKLKNLTNEDNQREFSSLNQSEIEVQVISQDEKEIA